MQDQKVYKLSFEDAAQSGETKLYHQSARLDQECAQAIDKAVSDSHHAPNKYDLKAAVAAVVAEFGVDRCAWVVSNVVQRQDYDGRYSNDNKNWAKSFDNPPDNKRCLFVNTHSYIMDGFVNKLREVVRCICLMRQPCIQEIPNFSMRQFQDFLTSILNFQIYRI